MEIYSNNYQTRVKICLICFSVNPITYHISLLCKDKDWVGRAPSAPLSEPPSVLSPQKSDKHQLRTLDTVDMTGGSLVALLLCLHTWGVVARCQSSTMLWLLQCPCPGTRRPSRESWRSCCRTRTLSSDQPRMAGRGSPRTGQCRYLDSAD